MSVNLKNKLLGIALVGMMWVGSQPGCEVSSAYLGGLVDYYPAGEYVSPYGPGGYAPACCDSYDYYGGGFYYDDYSWW